ncbi:MAG: STN domain-containing protein [Candidatus Riflebacteria bacterium]|nr:STN domain-containing protein [Candidatus Riflebacteria bacterium]
MKKLIVTVFLLSLVFAGQMLYAQNAELEGAITRLWTTGPDAKIEQILKTHSESNVPTVAAKASFHLACLQALSDSENTAPILARLEIAAQTDAEKATVKTLKEILQTRANKLPDSFQQKISLDFRNTDLTLVVKIIAQRSNSNIVVHSKIRKVISIRLADATIAQALDTICAMADLRYENRNGVFVLLPMQVDSKNYLKRQYRLSSLSPTRAMKLLDSHVNPQTGSNAPANFATDNESGKPAPTLPPGVTAKADGNSIIFEGEPEAAAKYVSFLENLDLKDRAHKISFRIWQLNPDSKLDIKAFTDLNEKERNKVARIVSAPAIIALPGKHARIEVDNVNNEKTDPPKEALDYSIDCKFNDTESPDQLRINFEITVYGTSVINGEPLKVSKKYNTEMQIKRNKWIMLPFYQGESLLYLETQVISQQPD